MTAACNENIGLTAIHQVFHSEHDRLVDDIEAHPRTTPAKRPHLTTLADWQRRGAERRPASATASASSRRPGSSPRWSTSTWSSRSSPARCSRRSTRSSRSPSPRPTSTRRSRAEFAHAVYRFGHSMLTETIAARRTPDGIASQRHLAARRVPEPAGVHRRRHGRHADRRRGRRQHHHGHVGPGRQRARRVRHRDAPQQPARPAAGPARRST